MIYKNNYRTLDSSDCFSTCLSSYLSYLNITFNYDALFILGQGLHFINDPENFMTMVSYKNISDIYFDALDQLQIKYICGKVKTDPYKFLIQTIGEELPLILRVSTGCLEYNPSFKENMAVGHFINAIGFDPDKKMIYISDGYVPTRKISKFQDWVPMEEILHAWAVYDNEYYVINKKQEKVNTEKINEQLHASLTDTMTQDFLSSALLFTKNLWDIMSTDNIERTTYMIVLQLKIYGFFPGLEYLKKCISKSSHEGFEQRMNFIINDWNLVAFMIIKLRFEQTKQYCEKICDKIYANTDRLKILMNDILESKLFLNLE